MAALKVLVIGMGVLIVLGIVVLVTTLASRITETKAVWENRLSLPEGHDLLGVIGTRDRVILHTRDANGEALLLAVDPASGKTLGRLTIQRRSP